MCIEDGKLTCSGVLKMQINLFRCVKVEKLIRLGMLKMDSKSVQASRGWTVNLFRSVENGQLICSGVLKMER